MGFWDWLVSGGKSGNYGVTPGSNADMLDRISMANAGTDVILPGLGPQVPAGNIGTTTNSIPGSVFDTGFLASIDNGFNNAADALNKAAYTWGGAAGSRTTTDLNAWPFHLPDIDLTPTMNKIGEAWDKFTGSLSHPGVSLDQVQGKTAAPDMKNVLVIGALGTAAAIAALAMTRKH